MRASCIICSDLFDEVNPISVGPCGHVYHTTCLTLWIDQSKTCPECRTHIAHKDKKRLYFNFPPKGDLNTSQLENEVLDLKGKLSAKDLELVACKKQKDAISVYVREAEKKASDLQQQVYKYDTDISELRLRIKSYTKLEAKVLKLEQMNAALMNDMQHLNNVQTIVNGTQKDVEDILKDYNDHTEASKQLATYCTCLKRELQKLIESKSKLVALNSKLGKENGLMAGRIKFYEEAMAISKNRGKSPVNSATPAKKIPLFESNENSPLVANVPSTSIQNACSEEFNISPLSVPFNQKKFNMCIKTSTAVTYKYNYVETQTAINCKSTASAALRKKNDDDSVIRTGYNGLGGHSNFVAPSGVKKIKILKKKL